MEPDSKQTGWLSLLAVVAGLATVQLWLRPLLPVDETRYLSVAWEMWQRGDFLVPYLNGEPYSHKPPLLFWLIHVVWAVTGVSELAARLVPLLLSLVALWWSAGLADRLWPDRAGRIHPLVPWLLFGGVFWNHFFTLVQFDLLLVLTALLAWRGVLAALHAPLRGWSLVGLGIGLGVLAKGPVILVPVLPAILFAPWWTTGRAHPVWPAWYLGGFAALLLGTALALLWAIPAGMAGGEVYRQAIFWGQSAGRIVSSFAHRSPWWSYLLWLPLMWLPWVLWPPLWKAARRGGAADPGVRFCLAVILPALVVFSLISGKQGKYLLPLFPLMALLLARWLAELDGQTRQRPWVAGVLLLPGGLALLVLPWLSAGPAWWSQVQPLWGLVLLAAGAALFWWQLPPGLMVRVTAMAVSLWTAALYLALVPPLAPQYDLQPMSRTLHALQQNGQPLAWLGKYHGQFHFLGRLQARIEPLAGPEPLHDWLRANPQGYLLVNYRGAAPEAPDDLQRQPYRGGWLVLWPAQRLLRDPVRLDALQGSG
ncbi:MAG TPA: glycosyltransferase family 39 protein [Gammaproteobacteria bacterium]|nr:glycosyltransferase family 39 protein [Gammaproteobacteria bacterium]